MRADADAWIEQNSPGNNKGADSTLKVKSQGPQDNFRTLVRFPLPTGVPAECELASATLRLSSSSATTGRTLAARPLLGPWSESGVTWANQPPSSGDASLTTSGPGLREWNVTGQVSAMISTGGSNGFVIQDTAEGGSGSEQSFAARELRSGPQLVLRFVPSG